MAEPRDTLPNRLMRNIMEAPVPPHRLPFLPEDAGPCWLWQKAVNNAGYGQVKWRDQIWALHRLSYHLCVSPLAKPGRVMAKGDDYVVIDHLCEQRACCNPRHLEAKTQSDNIKAGARHRKEPS